MRFLFLSESGDGLGIAHQLVKEGHDVDYFIKEAGYGWAGRGIVNRVTSWRPRVAKADLVVCDMVGFGLQGDVIRKLGKPILSCDKVTDLIELDRAKGMEVFRKLGIKIPETYDFKNPEEAKSLLTTWEAPGYVVKPSGNKGTAQTRICKDKESFEYALEVLEKGSPLIVQRIVEGVEVSTEGWWNGRGWIEPFNHTFEEKRFLAGDLGPNTGCMGNIVIGARRRNKLVKETVAKLEPFLKRTSYRGPVDINTIVNESGAYALEATARFGYDAIEALMEGLSEPIADVLFETALGVKKEFKLTEEYMIASRLSVPPWPHADEDGKNRGLPILGLNDKNLKHIYLSDAYRDGNKYYYAASDGVVLKATARGASVREAQRRVLRTLDNIQVSDKQYRRDIGGRVDGAMSSLKDWRYL